MRLRSRKRARLASKALIRASNFSREVDEPTLAPRPAGRAFDAFVLIPDLSVVQAAAFSLMRIAHPRSSKHVRSTLDAVRIEDPFQPTIRTEPRQSSARDGKRLHRRNAIAQLVRDEYRRPSPARRCVCLLRLRTN